MLQFFLPTEKCKIAILSAGSSTLKCSALSVQGSKVVTSDEMTNISMLNTDKVIYFRRGSHRSAIVDLSQAVQPEILWTEMISVPSVLTVTINCCDICKCLNYTVCPAFANHAAAGQWKQWIVRNVPKPMPSISSSSIVNLKPRSTWLHVCEYQ